jgi:hypothetical protein
MGLEFGVRFASCRQPASRRNKTIPLKFFLKVKNPKKVVHLLLWRLCIWLSQTRGCMLPVKGVFVSHVDDAASVYITVYTNVSRHWKASAVRHCSNAENIFGPGLCSRSQEFRRANTRKCHNFMRTTHIVRVTLRYPVTYSSLLPTFILQTGWLIKVILWYRIESVGTPVVGTVADWAKLWKYCSVQCWPISERALVCVMVRTLSTHALLRGVLRWKWVWSISNKMLTGKNQSTITMRPPCNCTHRSAYMDWPGIELEPVRWEAGDLLNHGRVYKLKKKNWKYSSVKCCPISKRALLGKLPGFSHLSFW